MQRLNVRFCLLLLGSILVVSTALVVVYFIQAGNIASALLWQAEQAQEQDRVENAIKYLARYLEFAPQDQDRRAQLGKLMADPSIAVSPRARRRAAFVLQQVLARDPDQHESRRHLVRLLVEAGDLEKAQEQLGLLQQRQPDSAETLELTGRLHEARSQIDEAIGAYRQALRAQPTRPDPTLKLVQLLRIKHEDHPAACAAEIEQVMKAVQTRFPGNVLVLQASADWAIDILDFPTARQRLEQALQLNPRQARVYQTLARLEMKENHPEEAVKVLREGLKKVVPLQRFDINWTLGNLLIDLDRVADCRAVITALEKMNPGNVSARYLEGRILIQQKRWFEAAAVLERLRGMVSNTGPLAHQVDLNLNSCYENLVEPARQLAVCHRLLEREPRSQVAMQGAATAAMNLGRTDLALDYQKRLIQVQVERKEGTTGRLDYARMLFLSNTNRDPRRWREIEEALNLAEREQPSAVEVPLLRAEVLLGQNQPQKSEEMLRQALRLHGKDMRLWNALLVLAERSGVEGRVQAVLKEAEQTAGDSVGLRLTRARLLMREESEQRVTALRQLEQTADRFSAEERTALLAGLADVHFRLKNTVEAERLWRQVLATPTHEKDLRIRMVLFDLAQQNNDTKRMNELLQEIRHIEGADGNIGDYCTAVRLIHQARQGDRSGLGQARQLLRQLVAARSSWAPPVLASADLEIIEGKTEAAITRFRQAIDLGIRQPQVVRTLVELLASQGRHEEAELEIRKVQRGGQLQGELQKLAVALSLRRDDQGRVDELLQQNTVSESSDYRDHLWLGQVLATGKPPSAEAERALRQAVKLGRKAPETWITLVRYLVNAGRSADAEKEIAALGTAVPLKDAPLTMAVCWEIVGQLDRAKEQYQLAGQARAEDAGVLRAVLAFHVRQEDWAAAEPGLRRIVAGQIKAQPADLDWARQTLATVLLARNPRNHLSEALALVGLQLDGQGKLIDDPKYPKKPATDLARARVLATQQRLPLVLKAISLLEEVNRSQQLGPDDQFLLARLYLTRARQENPELWWSKASDLLRAVATVQGRNPSFLRFHAQSLLEFGAVREAEQITSKLEQLERIRSQAAGSLGSVELRARILEARKQPAEAVRLLEQWARQPGAPAERLLSCASLQARQGRLKEALDLCAEAGARLPAERGLAGAVEAARTVYTRFKVQELGNVWTEQTSRLETHLRELSARQPDNLIFRLQHAELLDLMGRRDEVEKCYRAVLERDGDHPVALNNLAWLLTQQQPARAEEALKLINRAIGKLGPVPDLLDTRAVVYLALNQPQPAVADLEQATRESPSAAKYFHLVQAHYLARNTQTAAEMLQRAHAAGLQPTRLHPLEQEAYQRLNAELKGGQ